MSDTQIKSEVLDYISETRFAVLNYVRSDLTPVSRAIGSFAPDGATLYFSTGKETAKVRELAQNKRVSFYFEQGNQAADRWKSVLLIGDATPLSADTSDYAAALEVLGDRNPRFKERIDKGDLGSALIYRVDTVEYEYLDRSKGVGPTRKIPVRKDACTKRTCTKR